MRSASREVFPLFRSPAQAQVVTWLYLSGECLTTVQVEQLTGLTRVGVHRLLQPLLRSGVLRQQANGRQVSFEANLDAPFYAPLRALVAVTDGPPALIGAALSHLDQVREAYIFGSYAARCLGQAGPMPADLDLLVVGEVTLAQVADALAGVQEMVARPVHPVVVSVEAWQDPTGFVAAVQERALLRLSLHDPGLLPERSSASWQDELAELTAST